MIPGPGARTARAFEALKQAFVRHPRLDATITPVGDGPGIGVKR